MEIAILYGVGKKMRCGYLNGKYSETSAKPFTHSTFISITLNE